MLPIKGSPWEARKDPICQIFTLLSLEQKPAIPVTYKPDMAQK